MSGKDFDAWKYVKVDKKSLENNPYLNPKKVEETKEEPKIILSVSNDLVLVDYDLIKTSTYALGIDTIKKSKKKLAVPFMVNNLEARLKQAEENPNTKLNDLSLWNNWLDSNCGICYKGKGSGEFKLTHNCQELVDINKDFKDSFLSASYKNYKVNNKTVFKLDFNDTSVKYNELLSYDEVINHKGWLALVQNNKDLLEKYATLVFKRLKEEHNKDKGMRFWVNKSPEAGELRALYVYDIISNSDADGNDNLDSLARFLRVAHK